MPTGINRDIPGWEKDPPPTILANPVVLSPVSFSHALSQHGYSQKRSSFSSLQVKQTHAAHTHLFGAHRSR